MIGPKQMIAHEITVATAVRCRGRMEAEAENEAAQGPDLALLPSRVSMRSIAPVRRSMRCWPSCSPRSPDTEMIGRLASLTGDATPLGAAHAALGEAAARTDVTRAGREFLGLFTGLGAGELQPYASHYLTGSLYGRPLSRLRETLRRLGIERAAGHSEPEDHVAASARSWRALSMVRFRVRTAPIVRSLMNISLPGSGAFLPIWNKRNRPISTAASDRLAEFSWALKRRPLAFSRLEYLT